MDSRLLLTGLFAIQLAACGGGGEGEGDGEAGTTVSPSTSSALAKDYAILANNDLGMHCIDREFSVFSILPPFNVLNAQVVKKSANGPQLLDSNSVELRYAAVADASGSYNSTSLGGKTDFWQYAGSLFGMSLNDGEGLTGLYMPADHPVNPGPQAMSYQNQSGLFTAAGIPITPLDDTFRNNPFSLLRISAIDKTTGTELAHVDTVVPVAQETDCRNCHASGEIAANDPSITWSSDSDLEIQTKRNILLLHDAKHGSRYATPLINSQPVLCANCHYSAALDLGGTGPQGDQRFNPSFSAVMHGFHGRQTDAGGAPLFPANGTPDQTCYQCHPGKQTQCLRGAMYTGGIECSSCHGDMLAVGGDYPLQPGGSVDGSNDGAPRRPWTDLPRCQSCHTGDALSNLSGTGYVKSADGLRLRQAYKSGDTSASPILAVNKRFAENSDTLFRFSKGHGGVACEGCHGSTHAIWANADPGANDNVAANQLQGHSGTITECGTCHAAGSLALTTNGPHGMHNVNDAHWINENHGGFYRRDRDGCRSCHGQNLEGTVLARVSDNRSFRIEGKTVNLNKGQEVSCNLCHRSP